MENYKLDIFPGTSIYEAAETGISVSKQKKQNVEFNFNGILVVIDGQKDTKESVVSEWKRSQEEKAEAYRKTDEYKERELARKKELESNQDIMDSLMDNFPDIVDRTFVQWLKDFSEKADYVGVTYDKNLVLKKLERMNFEENAYVGYKEEFTTEILIKYTVGQVISCINNFGTPHPITSKFCDDILARDDLDSIKSTECVF
jgi:hypothetical protein